VSVVDGACAARLSNASSVSSTVLSPVTIGAISTLGSATTRRSSRISGRGRWPGSMRMFTVASAVPGSTLARNPPPMIVGTKMLRTRPSNSSPQGPWCSRFASRRRAAARRVVVSARRRRAVRALETRAQVRRYLRAVGVIRGAVS
jgi:hypothetical protein